VAKPAARTARENGGERQRVRVVLDVCAMHRVAGKTRKEAVLHVKGTRGRGRNAKDGAFFMLGTSNASESADKFFLVVEIRRMLEAGGKL
jgi:hypothetical protein